MQISYQSLGKGYEIVSNLLPTNTMILHEASSLLYRNSCFDLSSSSPRLIPEFFDNIGLVNASHLICIRIGVPEFGDLEEEVSLDEESLRTERSEGGNSAHLTG
jgi:hypothetical protein